MSKTIAESFDDLHAASREAGRAFGEAVAETRLFKATVAACAWIDARVPWLGWIGDHSPRWIRFGTSEFFEMVGTVYLIVAGVVVVVWLLNGALSAS